MSIEVRADVKKVVESYCEAWNAHDVERLVDFCNADSVYESLYEDKVLQGKEELKTELNTLFSDLPGIKLEWPAYFVTGDMARFRCIVSAMRANGTHAPTEDIAQRQHDNLVVEVRGDKITRHSD